MEEQNTTNTRTACQFTPVLAYSLFVSYVFLLKQNQLVNMCETVVILDKHTYTHTRYLKTLKQLHVQLIIGHCRESAH